MSELAFDEEGVPECELCLAHMHSKGRLALLHSFASVGVEHGASSAQIARRYFRALHLKEGHDAGADDPAAA